MRSVTKQAIREARLKEIKEELLHSERLKVRLSIRGGRRISAAEFVLSTRCRGGGSAWGPVWSACGAWLPQEGQCPRRRGA